MKILIIEDEKPISNSMVSYLSNESYLCETAFDLATAKEKFLEARAAYKTYFKENPEAKLKNMVFGEMNKYEWYLMERKHLNHHFEQFGLI